MSQGSILRPNRSNSRHAQFARTDEYDPYHQDNYDARYAGAARAERMHGHRAAIGRDDEEIYDEPPRGRWRRRLAVLTLIAVGTYAYRTYYVAPGSTQTPTVVGAEEMPGRVIPVVTDPQAGKLIQDRVGVPGSGDRRTREEQPVEPRSASSTTGWAWPSPPAPSPQGAASAPDNTSTDPKRVATLRIRPDG